MREAKFAAPGRGMRALAACLTIGALVLAGCGGDDDGSAADDIADAIDDNEVTPEEAEELDDDLTDDTGDGGDDDAGGDLPDACELVTQEDAAELFELEAVKADEAGTPSGAAECIWENVGSDELGNPSHLLQMYVWPGEAYYSEEAYPEAEPIDDLGDRAFVASEGSVDVLWVQDGKTFSLSYTILNIGVEGETVEAPSRADAVVDLAHQASERA